MTSFIKSKVASPYVVIVSLCGSFSRYDYFFNYEDFGWRV